MNEAPREMALRKRDLDQWVKTKKKYARNSEQAKTEARRRCPHVHADSNRCSIATLTDADIQNFRQQLYQQKTAVEQNKFLSHYIVPYYPATKRPRTETPRTRCQNQYFLRSLTGTLVILCATAFQNITGIKRKRLNSISKNFITTGDSPVERRGGARNVSSMLEVKRSIVAHIKSFPVRDSHYGRAGTCRQFLPCDLSIAKMYNQWKEARKAENLSVVKYHTYRKIFRDHFNLSFKSPATDICSTCEQYAHLVRANINKAENVLQWKLHKLRAKKFYSLMKTSRTKCNVLTVAFDLQKNLPLPKTNVGEEYYCRQLWMYNLAFVIDSPKPSRQKNVFMYNWMEHQSGKGSNEICSALADFLRRIRKRVEKRGYKHLALFSDGCAGQNKNSTMLGFLLSYVNSKLNVFKDVTYTFPVRGHSYLPPDRVFANIERRLRRLQTVAEPEQYYTVIQRFGRLKVLGRDWYVHDYKALSESILKRNPFASRRSRIWKFVRNSDKVYVSDTYNETFQTVAVCKKNHARKLCGLRPKILSMQTHVSHEKKKDVEKLLEFIPLSSRGFYAEALAKSVTSSRKEKQLVHPIEKVKLM